MKSDVNILIVEDEIIQAFALESLLRQLGYEHISTASSREEALEKIPAMSDCIVILDINLGVHEDGIEFAMELSKQFLPVIFLTANVDLATMERARKAIPYGYLTKPVSGSDLKNAIEMALYRSEMERRLRESEKKYRTLFESIPLGVTVTDESGNIIESNPAAERLLKIERSEQQGRHIGATEWRIVRLDDSPMPPEEFASVRALRTGEIVENVEMGLVDDGGQTTWLNVTASPLSMEGYGVVVAYSDITIRKKIDDAYEFFARREWDVAEEDFFVALVRYLSGELEMEHVWISRITGNGRTVALMAINTDGSFDISESYPVDNTYLADVLARGFLIISENVSEKYPSDSFLRSLRCNCFAGIAITDSTGRAIGFICGAGNGIIKNPELAWSILRIAAVNSSAQLERRKFEKFQSANSTILEMVALGVELDVIFFLITQIIKEWDPGMICEIRLVSPDGKSLNIASAPDLPAEFAHAASSVEINPAIGTWGAAVLSRKHEFSSDLASDPRFTMFRELLTRVDFHACWSFLILSTGRDVLGTLSVYHRISGEPGKEQMQIMEAATHLASIALESKRSKEKLFLLSQAIEHSPSVVVITDSKGAIEYVNNQFVELTGYSFDEARGKNPRILNAGILPHEHYKQLWKTISAGKIWTGEFCNKKKNGELFWEHAAIAPVKNSYGKIVNYVAVKEDITEKKIAEKKLEQNFKRTETLLRLFQMTTQSLEEIATFVLDHALEITGSTIGFLNVISEEGNDYIPIAFSKSAMQSCSMEQTGHFLTAGVGWLLEAVNEKKPMVVNDYRIDHPMKKGLPHGHSPIHRFMAVPVVDQDRVVLLAGVANKERDYDEDDVSNLRLMIENFWGHVKARRKDEELRRERTRLFTLLDNIPDPVYQKDLEGCYVLVNTATARVHGFESPAAMIGKCDSDFFPSDEAARNREEEIELTSHRKTFINREICIKKDGIERWYSMTKVPLLDGRGDSVGVVEIHRDITEMRMMFEGLKKAKDAAEQANRAKSAFLANMSHELRTPLNAIIGFSELLMDAETDPQQRRQYLGYIHDSGLHLLEMVNDILDLSKIEAGRLNVEKKPFSLKMMLERVHSSTHSLAMRKNIAMEFDIDSNIGYINADEVRVKQILLNLISNAIKFTPAGKRIGVIARSDADYAFFTVWDEGIGIAFEDQQRIFKPFEQVESARFGTAMGTGLGLAIAKRLVEMHDGTIGVESVPGEGSRFTVSLPGRFNIETENEIHRQPSEKPVFEEKIRGAKVLVVDDNEINRELIQIILSKCGCESRQAVSGEEALKLVTSEHFDIILMDIQMPGMDGVEATRRIRNIAKRHIPIIALTAYAMKGDREKFLEMGMDDYIAKPFEVQRIYEVLEKYTSAVLCEEKEKPKPKISLKLEEAALSLQIPVEDYIALVRKFIDRSGDYLDGLREAYARGDTEKLRAEAHRLKGVALNMRFERLAAIAKEIEEAARTGVPISEEDIASAEDAIGEIIDAVKNITI